MEQGTGTNGEKPGPTSSRAAQGDDQPPAQIPDHQLLRCIGRGSYGEVWLARNMMGAYRAVKIVSRKSFEHQRPFDRELAGIRKFEPISRSHEGFVDVLQVGINEAEGYFYYVMELGDDQTSGQSIDPEQYTPRTLARDISLRKNLPFAECLQLGLSLSDALTHLHQHSLVHRDIKPSNIIFVNGIPKLADIGLVADISEARSYVGTEGFIPPEGPGLAQADIYSLGKVLYEASTGRDRHDFPELPTLLDQVPDLDRFLELNEVILHACKDDVHARYQSAADLNADLVVVANGRSVKRLKLLERRLATFKRAAIISLGALVLLAFIFYQVYREWRVASDDRQRKVGSDIALGNRAMDSGDLLGALPYFANALSLERGEPRREEQHRLRFGSTLAQCPKLVQMWFLPKRANTAAFSPDGRQVLVTEQDGKARVFDTVAPESAAHPFGQDTGLLRGAYSPDGKLVVTSSEDKTARIWRVEDRAEVLRLPHPNKVMSARFSPDGLRVLTACLDGVARVLDARTGHLQMSLNHTNFLLYATFSPDGRLIATTSRDGRACIWETKDGRSIGPPLRHPSWVVYAAFSPDSRQLVTACSDRKARVWNMAEGKTGEWIPPDLHHQDAVNSAEFSPDGQSIVTACLDRAVYFWQAESHQPLSLNPNLRHTDRVMHAGFSADGHRIVTTCADGTVRVWDLAGSVVAPTSVRHSFSRSAHRYLNSTEGGTQVCDTLSGRSVSPLIPVAAGGQAMLNSDGEFVLTLSTPLTGSVGSHCALDVWETATGHRVGAPIALPNTLPHLALSKDGRCLLSYGGSKAQTWSVATGGPWSQPVLHSGKVESAVINDEGSRVASWSGTEVRVWDAATGRELFPPLQHAMSVTFVAFSPDGTRLVICCADNGFSKCVAQIRDAMTGQPVCPPMQHGDGVLFAAFDQSGTRIVTTGEDFAAIEWNTLTGAQLAPPLKHGDQALCAEFSPDGRWIVTASADATARIWIAENGDPLTPPLRHPSPPLRAKFVAGGQIITSTMSGRSWVWSIPKDAKPVEDQLLLARLLSGDPTLGSVPPNTPHGDDLKAIWQRLRGAYPSDFATSVQAPMQWHEFQAEVCEGRKQWFAASFHLKRLLTIRPNDPLLVERLARAQKLLQADGLP